MEFNDKHLNPPDPETHANCMKCGGRFDIDDMMEMGDDEWLCRDCQEEWFLCSNCGELFPAGAGRYILDEGYICNNCLV